MTPVAKFDSADFRRVMGHYPTGVCVVTATNADGSRTAMVVGSFTSVSLEPPLVAFFPDRSSKRWKKIEAAKKFCVNILSHEQEDLCRRFASTSEDILPEIAHRVSGNGSPVLDDVVAWIDCNLERADEAGDHYFVLGRVVEMEVERAAPPLMFFQGGYGSFSPLVTG